VQHIALATSDIHYTVGKLRAQGVEFLTVPTAYYDDVQRRVGSIDEPFAALATKPVEDRPTLFYETIERKGSRGVWQREFQGFLRRSSASKPAGEICSTWFENWYRISRWTIGARLERV